MLIWWFWPCVAQPNVTTVKYSYPCGDIYSSPRCKNTIHTHTLFPSIHPTLCNCLSVRTMLRIFIRTSLHWLWCTICSICCKVYLGSQREEETLQKKKQKKPLKSLKYITLPLACPLPNGIKLVANTVKRQFNYI